MLGTQTGSDPVLKKPFNREALGAAVTRALRRPLEPPTARLVPLR
jgi:DNA-binding response OmpR family regulator